jgi:putative transposase
MYKAYKYRLYPTAEQKVLIEKAFGCCRLVYNLALETKICAYKSAGINLSAIDLCYQLPELKQEFPWLQEVDSQALQSQIKSVENTFKRFFTKGTGFPRFKSKRGRQSFSCPNNTRRIDFEKELLTIPKIKDIPIRISRAFDGKIKTVTISRTPTGKYFASVLVDNSQPLPEKGPVTPDRIIGIDVGIKDFAVLSDGTRFANHRHLRNSEARLVCLQRRYARKQKGSKNKEKARKKLALCHEKITNQRKDFLHKASTAITKQYDGVCIESLRISNMLKNCNLSKSISDAGWGEFFRQLEYKLDWKGGQVFKLPTFFPSSIKCSVCGEVRESLTLSERRWECACGATHDRDENAAKNIMDYFTRTGGHAGIACGGGDVGLTYEAGRYNKIY